MPELRWTLLILGALFIAGLAFWEYRRQRHARGQTVDRAVDRSVEPRFGESSDEPPRAVYREPTLNFPDVHLPRQERDPMAELPVVEIEDKALTGIRVDRQTAVDSFSMRADDDEVRDEKSVEAHDTDRDADEMDLDADQKAAAALPLVPRLEPAEPMRGDLRTGGAAEQIGDRAIEDFDEGVIGSARVVGDAPVPELGVAAQAPEAPAAPAAPFDVDTDVFAIKDPIVEWPEDETRKIIALRLVSGGGDRFSGRAVRLALAAEGFLLGKFDIFHKPGPDARAVLSAASLTKPGSFSIATMDTQRYGGLSLFAVLPGPLSPTATFDELLITARSLNDRLRGALQDERGEPLTSVRATALRDSLIAQATAAAPVVGPPTVAE